MFTYNKKPVPAPRAHAHRSHARTDVRCTAQLLEPRRFLSATYDAANDYSAANNPNGAWTYGEFVGATFYADSHPLGNRQWNGTHSQTFSLSSIQESDGSQLNGTGTGPLLWLDSGSLASGVEAAVRWTAPASGTYSIQGAFSALYNVSPQVPVAVLKNGSTTLASGTVDATAAPSFALNQSVTVKAGDTLDFVVEHTDGQTYPFDDGGEVEAVITAQQLGPINDSPLQPSISGRLPSSALVAGGRMAPIAQTFRLTNTGSTTVSGPVTANVVLSADPTDASNGVTVASVSRRINLRPNHSEAFPLVIRSLPASLTGSGLYLLAQVTDPSGNTGLGASSGTITSQSPFVDLSGAFARVPTTVKAGRKGTVTLTLTNNGNIAATGNLPIDLQASPDGSLGSAGSVDLGTVTRHVSIQPGKHVTLSLVETFPSTGGPYFVLADVDPNNTFNDSDLSNNVFASQTAVNLS